VFNWRKNFDLPAAGGALVTQTGLVFTGELDGKFDSYDTKTGKRLYQYDTGSTIIAPPMSFEQDGKQYVVVASGEVGNQKVPELTKPSQGAMITAFALK
jgi:alcohol dehydrogenase (cytochrome c)